MYCSGCGLGADSFIPGGQKVGGVGGSRPFQQTGAPLPPGFGTRFSPPVLKQKIPVSCPGTGITYYFDTPEQAAAFKCPPKPGAAPAGGTPSQPPATGGATPGTDYNDPSTWPTAPNLPAPSPATSGQINSIPSGGGGGAMIDDSAAGPVQAAGMFGNIPPVALAALAVGAFFLLRKRR